MRRPVNRLELGPIVGHTDDRSVRIWIRTADDPSAYLLRVRKHGVFPFQSTETGTPEFGTAIAVADGLRADWRYTYDVLRRGRVVRGGGGSFRTMPPPASMTDVSFVTISCSDQQDEGAWAALAQFVEESGPRFLLAMGDQVYLDSTPDVFLDHLDSEPAERRKAMADKYQENWSRDPVRRVFANVPTYMMWDDHDIRDGWGSLAPDSPTLAGLYPAGQEIFQRYDAYFKDARDLYWHFQACRNPLPDHVGQPSAAGKRQGMPFVVRCGRAAVLVVDGRGDRDLWRPVDPILGSEQWQFIDQFLDNLDATIDALAFVTPVPIVSMAPDGQTQFLLGRRTDDVDLFQRGDAKGLLNIHSADDVGSLAEAAVGGWVAARFGVDANLGSFKLSEIDDARDHWSNHFGRVEQERIIRRAFQARLRNRIAALPRALVFAGGDIHAGAIFDVTLDQQPDVPVPCVISSGIGKQTNESLLLGTLVDEDFEVAPGIRASLRQLINTYNFGIIEIIPTGGTPIVIPTVAFSGESTASGARVSLPI